MHLASKNTFMMFFQNFKLTDFIVNSVAVVFTLMMLRSQQSDSDLHLFIVVKITINRSFHRRYFTLTY